MKWRSGRPTSWKDEPDGHDFDAAQSYLSLVAPPILVRTAVAHLQRVPLVQIAVKDVIRASALPLLPADNYHVRKDLKRIRQGRALSPVLLVRSDFGIAPLVIADGYHRVCAVYHNSEDDEVYAHVASWSG